MRDEILKAKGRLAEDRHKRKELSLEAKGLVALLRNALDPYEPDIARLPIPEAAANMDRLAAVHREIGILDGQIDELGAALGHVDG